MSDDASPRSASPEEIAEALSYALRFNGKKPFPQSHALMARVTAEHLVEHLLRCGFEITKRPASAAPSTSGHGHPLAGKPGDP